MHNLNIVVMGKTGAGKSTLVNAVLGEDVAPIGKGQAVTKENQLYSKTLLLPLGSYDNATGTYSMIGKKLNLCDTVGLELDETITKATLEEIKQGLCEAEKAKAEKDIIIVWFCVNCQSDRFEEYEVQLIRELSIEYEIPFVIVITKCFDEEKGALEQQIERDLPEVSVVRVLAKEHKSRIGVIPAHGLQELLQRSVMDYDSNKVKILESKLDKLESDRQKYLDGLKTQGQVCVAQYKDKAEKIAYVPLACIPIVHGICIKMMSALHDLVGIKSKKGFSQEIFSDAVVGAIATPFMAVPILSAAVASAYVETVGKAYLEVLLSVINRSTNVELQNNELMAQRIREELKKHKK